ncbi:hypothetical protein C8Q78DRAFT_204886 [Trametes maxima]|nr:hypothetical protein C8Q78DRAFT_204886 [Trametes maxima]
MRGQAIYPRTFGGVPKLPLPAGGVPPDPANGCAQCRSFYSGRRRVLQVYLPARCGNWSASSFWVPGGESGVRRPESGASISGAAAVSERCGASTSFRENRAAPSRTCRDEYLCARSARRSLPKGVAAGRCSSTIKSLALFTMSPAAGVPDCCGPRALGVASARRATCAVLRCMECTGRMGSWPSTRQRAHPRRGQLGPEVRLGTSMKTRQPGCRGVIGNGSDRW